MKYQPDTSLRIRLAGIAIICLFIALALAAYFSGQRVKRDSDLVAKDAVPGTIAAHLMRMDMSRSIGWVMVAASAQTTESRDESLATVHQADVDFANHVEQYQATIKIDPAKDQALLAAVTSQYARFQQQRMAYEALVLTGDRSKSDPFLENELVPAYVAAIAAAKDLLDYNHANSLAYANNISNSVHRLYWAVAVVMVLALICAAVLIVNLSVRRRELRELRESEELFRASFDNATVGVCLVATGGKFLKVNRTLCSMLGYSEDELLQLTFSDVTQDEDREIGRKFLDDALSGGPKTMRTEKRYLRKDGQVVWANLSTALVEKPGGQGDYLISHIQDITERKRATEQLEMLKVSIDKHFDGTYWMDANDRFVYVNDSACKALGYAREELLGQPITLIAPQVTPRLMEDVWKSLRDTGFFTRESSHRRKDGSVFPIELVASYVRFEGKEFNCSFARDITERKRLEQKQVELAAIVASSDDAIIGKSLTGIITSWNRGAEKIFGYAAAEVIGQPLLMLIPTDRQHEEAEVLEKIRRGQAVEHYETVRIRKDGRQITISATISPLKDGLGKVVGASKIARDITEQKRAEAALVALQSHQERTLSALGEGLQVIDRKGIITYENPAAAAMLGWEINELIDRFGHDLIHHTRADGAHYPQAECKILATLLDGVARRVDDEVFWRKDGTSFPVAYICTAMRDEAGEINEVVVAFRDITVQKRAVTELRATNARYTRQETALMALTRACALRQSGSKELTREVVQIAADTLEVERVSIWRYDRDRQGIVCQQLFQRSVRRYSDGTKLAAGDFPEYFRALAVGDIIAANDAHRDPRTSEFSEAYLRPLGISSMLDAPVHVMGIVAGVICCEQVGHAREWTADEQTFAIAIANLLSLLLAEEERQQIEGQFRQAQKMEAIGTLAGGIAHDFNNILAAINGYTEMAKRRVANDPVLIRYLDAVFQGGNRAVALVKQILTFSRRDETHERKPVELGKVVAEPLKLLRASIPSNIEFDVSLDPNLPSVLADATQVHQIVMNLCTNASHAMKDRPGRLGVRLENFSVDKLLAGANVDLQVGPYVRLSVSDTGHGMSKETIQRIFEPFFTTKGPGEGTGLGLSVVHGIMQSHGGAITVYSQPGEGTVFHLYFPVTTESSRETATVMEEPPAGHGKRILFVDDELPLALLGQSMLEELGYVVEPRGSVADALAVVRANPAAFDLVITDLTMPTMLGTDFARELLQLRPNLPIILTTGYTANLTPERVRDLGIRELLLKPHTIQSLGLAVHRVLNSQPRT